MLIQLRDGTVGLTVFHPFRPDESLPRRKKIRADRIGPELNVTWSAENQLFLTTPTSDPPKKEGPFAAFFRRLRPKPKSAGWFFRVLFETAKQVEEFKTDMAAASGAAAMARSLGQTALAERLESDLRLQAEEAHVKALGFGRFIEEADVVRFARATERGIRLDPVANFVRPIPADAATAKKRCDAANAFDAWVVLHWDPDGKATSMTKADRAKADDPILFGLIEGSRRLYFVADWVDDKCDLTFDELVGRLAAPVDDTTATP